MSTIAIDVDDTLYSFRDAARDELMRLAFHPEVPKDEQEIYQRAAYATWVDWRTPADLLGHRWMDVIDKCHEDEVILSREPFAGAVDVCVELFKEGHDLRYITSRKTHTKTATAHWLRSKGFPLGVDFLNQKTARLYVTGPDKMEYLKDCSALIDDRPSTVIRYLYQPGPCVHFPFVKAGEWNHNLTDVPGVYVAPTWAGIRHGLVK